MLKQFITQFLQTRIADTLYIQLQPFHFFEFLRNHVKIKKIRKRASAFCGH